MVNLKHFLRELRTRYYQAFVNKPVQINMERPIVSFTFDDVPRTAIINGQPILDSHNIKATFYVAMGLSQINSIEPDSEAYFTSDDVLQLHTKGHDIACHTYSHYALENGNANDLALDAAKNVELLKSTVESDSIKHFSYPFGQVNFKTKKMLSKKYKTMRSSRPGINFGVTDLYLLRATSIYSPTFDKKNIKSIIEKTRRYGGWLIFYTHGVADKPDNYSCTPDQLEWVIQQCKELNIEILSIADAYTKITSK
jgi:peptidoglycan/xylan/chitin deacetylase (PgdA/CDA1 family)